MKKFLLALNLLATTLTLSAQSHNEQKQNILDSFLTIKEVKWYVSGGSLYTIEKDERTLYGLSVGSRLYYPHPLYALDFRGEIECAKRTRKAAISASMLFFIDHFKHFFYYVGAGVYASYKSEKIIDDFGRIDIEKSSGDFKLSAGTEVRVNASNRYFTEIYYLPVGNSVGAAAGVCF